MTYTPTDLVEAQAVLSPLWWAKQSVPSAVPARYAPFHNDLIQLPAPGESHARIVYRGASKTTLTRFLFLHCAIHQRVRAILVVRNTYGEARQDIKSIRSTCLTLGVPFEVDAESNMIVVNSVPIWLRTPGSSVRGVQWTNPTSGEVVRPELIVVDDLETRESARSATRTKELGKWLTADVMATAGQQHPARTILLGTPITPNCLVAQAMRQEGIFSNWVPPLIVPIIDSDGVPAWPATWNPDLEATKTDDAWATEYLLNPLPAGTLLFPAVRTVWRNLPASHMYPIVIGVDPAGDGADATAAVAMCLTPRGLHIVDALTWTGSAENAPEQIGALVRRLQADGWKASGITFEGKGAWAFMKREVYTQVAPIPVTSETPVGSKVERALPLTVWHKNGCLSVDERLRGTPWDVEFHSFDNDGLTITGHDDNTDATAWAAAPLTRGWTVRPPDVA